MMRGETYGTSLQQRNIHPVRVVPRDENSGRTSTLNASSQTGEEFSEEFLRERLTPSRTPLKKDTFQAETPRKGTNVGYHQDFTGHPAPGTKGRDSESVTEISEFSAGKGYGLEVENQEMHDGANRYRREYTPSGLQQSKFSDGGINRSGVSGHGSGSPNSYQPYNSGWGFTNCSSTGKMKFLCSFGGKILPRPNDGNLRFVGGETRIMSIRKNLTYAELVKKTNSIFNQPHTIKYQLPGEDLDALISVSCDEDLHHMIEEYHDLERSNQRLRIFLVPLNDPESPCSLEVRTLSQVDSEYQYVVAINGMVDPSPRWSSSRESLGSVPDGSPTFQRDTPTTFHPMEFRDGGTPTNKMNHPCSSSQVFNASLQYHSKSYFAPSMFPPPVKLKDSRNSRTKLYEDIGHGEGHEFRSPKAMDQKPYHNSFHMDATSYYYNQQPETVSVKRNYHPVSPYQESNHVVQLHPQFHSPATDFVASPSYSNVEVESKSHVANEITRQSENLSFSQDTAVQSPGNSVLVNPSCRIVRGVSQAQLSDEGASVTLEEKGQFSPNFQMKKSPSFSGSPQQWTWQQLENSENHLRARNGNMLKPDWNKEGNKHGRNWAQNEGTSLDQHEMDSKLGNRNASDASDTSSTEDRSKLPEIVPRVGKMVIDQSLSVEAECPNGRASTSPWDSQEKTGEGQQRKSQSSVVESEFPIKRPKETEDHEHPVTIPISSSAIDRSCGQQTVACQGMDESAETSSAPVNLNHPPKNDLTFGNPVDRFKSVMVEGPRKNLKKEDSLGKTPFQDQMLSHRQSTKQLISNIPEATVIIEDVTGIIPLDIPSSPAVIPLVQHEPNDAVSPREETETESVAQGSDREEGKSEDDYKKKSIEDPVMIEMEAGIYGLQIIKYGDLEEMQELGSGTYGTVYHGKWRGTDVAIKRIKKSCFAGRHSEQDRLTTDFWREAKILSKLHHPNIVAFYGVVPDGPGATLSTVTEFMVDGSLRHVLLRKGSLDQRKKLMIAMDAAFGMEYLHLKNVVHFDLKCDNLLVNLGDPHRPVCKVGDFGLSRIKHNTLVSGGVRGTLPWMAPELLHGSSNRVSEKVDVFSFGITMWEMLTGEEPYANLHCGAIIGGIVNNTLRPRIPERCDPEWRKLMEECWSPDPEARPSFTEITKRLRDMSMALQAKRPNRARR